MLEIFTHREMFLKLYHKELRRKLWKRGFYVYASLIDCLPFPRYKCCCCASFFFNVKVTTCQAEEGPHRWVVEQKRKQDWVFGGCGVIHLISISMVTLSLPTSTVGVAILWTHYRKGNARSSTPLSREVIVH